MPAPPSCSWLRGTRTESEGRGGRRGGEFPAGESNHKAGSIDPPLGIRHPTSRVLQECAVALPDALWINMRRVSDQCVQRLATRLVQTQGTRTSFISPRPKRQLGLPAQFFFFPLLCSVTAAAVGGSQRTRAGGGENERAVCGGIPALVHRCFCRPNGSCCSCRMRSSSVSSGGAGFLLLDIARGLRRDPTSTSKVRLFKFFAHFHALRNAFPKDNNPTTN